MTNCQTHNCQKQRYACGLCKDCYNLIMRINDHKWKEFERKFDYTIPEQPKQKIDCLFLLNKSEVK